jgi:hypothetical protein
VNWRGTGSDRALFTEYSPRSKLAVGLLGGPTVELCGKRRATVDARLADGMLTFTIGPTHKTLWYEIETDAP